MTIVKINARELLLKECSLNNSFDELLLHPEPARLLSRLPIWLTSEMKLALNPRKQNRRMRHPNSS